MRIKLLIIIAILLAVPTSCKQRFDEKIQEEASSKDGKASPVTRSEPKGSEERDRIKKYQSNPVVLLNSLTVLEEDGTYKIQMSREEANSVGVSNEVYDKFLDYVVKLNQIRKSL